jgi:hypothetical protein
MPQQRPARLTLIASSIAVLLAACGGGDPVADVDAVVKEEAPQEAVSFPVGSLRNAPANLSGNVVCTNWRIGAEVLDNVEVAEGAACQLNGTVLRGSLQAQRAAVIDANRVQVAGSVQSEDGAYVAVRGSSQVTGNVEIMGGGGVDVRNSRISGDVFIDALTGPTLVLSNTVTGNVQITDNLGGGSIRGNVVTGQLQCSGNRPLPTVGANRAASIEGDCRAATGGQPMPPLSGNVTCIGLTIGAVLLDSVTVPAGASCSLIGTRLTGSLEVGAGARLVADGVNVTGDVLADGATSMVLGGSSTVSGSVQIQRGGSTSLVSTTVRGDLQIDAMRGPVVASANSVSGNLQAMANRGGVTLSANRVGGSMQCKDNLPAPQGSGNTAAAKQDQCLRL